MPLRSASIEKMPSSESPARMLASRKPSGLPGSTVSIHSATLVSSTAMGLRSTPWMQERTTSRRAASRSCSVWISPYRRRTTRLAMRRAAASRKCPEPQAGSITVTPSKPLDWIFAIRSRHGLARDRVRCPATPAPESPGCSSCQLVLRALPLVWSLRERELRGRLD